MLNLTPGAYAGVSPMPVANGDVIAPLRTAVLLSRWGAFLPPEGEGAALLLERPDLGYLGAVGLDTAFIGPARITLYNAILDVVEPQIGLPAPGVLPTTLRQQQALLAARLRRAFPAIPTAMKDAIRPQYHTLLSLAIRDMYSQVPRDQAVPVPGVPGGLIPGCYPWLAPPGVGKSRILRAIADAADGDCIYLVPEPDPDSQLRPLAGELARFHRFDPLPGLIVLDSLVEVSSAWTSMPGSGGTGSKGEPLGHLGWTRAMSVAANRAGVVVLASYPGFELTPLTMALIEGRASGYALVESPTAFSLVARPDRTPRNIRFT